MSRAAWALCGSREDAEDLVQEAYALVLRKPRILNTDNDLSYLLRVLRNTFISSRRTASRRPQTDPLPDRLDRVPDQHAVLAESRLEVGELYAAISTLPDVLREALVAVDIVGLSYRETARRLGAREATIATRIHRARKRVALAVLPGDGPPL
jgi:RNA polymerase sigma-70 factor, ECF subfamily